jgi:hypothetical protein
MKTLIAVVLATLSIWGAAVALADINGSPPLQPAPATPTPTTPPPPPTPSVVVATGGAGGSTSPGNSCIPRLGLRNLPGPQDPVMLWNQNGDVGWPFGAPGPVPEDIPTTAPSVGCSR